MKRDRIFETTALLTLYMVIDHFSDKAVVPYALAFALLGSIFGVWWGK